MRNTTAAQAALFCVLALAGGATAYTTVSGNVGGQTWGAGTWYASGNLTVANGTTLTLQPGAIVKFAPSTGATINGTISALGTEAQPIVFTSRDDNSAGETVAGSDGAPAPGDWQGLYCYGYSGNAGVGDFLHCRLSYGGNPAGAPDANLLFHYSNSGSFSASISDYSQTSGIRTTACSPVLTGSTLANNLTHGLSGGTGGTPLVTGCTFAGNGQYGAWLSGISPGSCGGNSGSGNGTNAFGLSGTAAGNPTWSANEAGFPYLLLGTVTVNNGLSLTLGPGTRVKAAAAGEIICNGTLTLAGSEDSLVVITSLKDDTVDGDSNGDGAATMPAPGDWRGIQCYGYSGNAGVGNFDWALLRYGGNTATNYDANLFYSYSNSGHFTHSASEHSQGYGLRVVECTPVLHQSSFLGSLSHGLTAVSGASPAVDQCQFTDNGGHGAWITGSTLSTYAGNSGSGNGVNGFAVAGTVAGNLNWAANAAGFPYVLGGTVTINNGLTLTLGPGLVMKGEPAGEIICNGTLTLAGTADSLVVVTSLKDDTVDGDSNGDGDASSPAPGDWRGIQCYGYSGNAGVGNFDWALLRYGGATATSYDANLYFSYSNGGHFTHSASEHSQDVGLRSNQCVPQIEQSAFNDNLGHGISATSGSAPLVNGCSFTGNGGYGAWCSGVSLQACGGNSGSGNGTNGFGVQGTVAASQTWSANVAGFPVVLTGQVQVNNGVALTLGAGLTAKGAAGSHLYVLGSVFATGTSEAPVRLTSLQDDAWDGDTNMDGAATSPAPGDWQGVMCYGYSGNTGQGQFQHSHLRYAGGGAGLAALRFYDSPSSFFVDGSVEASAQHGIRIYGSSPVVGGSVVSGNAGYGVFIESGTPVLGDTGGLTGGFNHFSGNNSGGWQVWNQSNTVVPACYNDWGFYTASMVDAHIRDDEESTPANRVLFEPFSPTPGVPWVYRTLVDGLGPSLTLTWMPVPGATGYAVYSGDESYGVFAPDGGGVFNGNNWTTPVAGAQRFYLVRALLPDEE